MCLIDFPKSDQTYSVWFQGAGQEHRVSYKQFSLQFYFCFILFLVALRSIWNFPDQGLNLCPKQQKLGFLITGLSGKSSVYL